jgi:hypothetical protein
LGELSLMGFSALRKHAASIGVGDAAADGALQVLRYIIRNRRATT